MTFKSQAETFLAGIQNRRRNPARVATVKAYKSFLNVHILPLIGEKQLKDVENGTLKGLVVELAKAGLKPASITSIVSVVKQVVGSAVDENGNQLYPRKWNNDFLDLPVIKLAEQDAPIVPVKTLERALGRAQGQDKALYALLAGTGLRVGEALALMVGSDDGKNSFWQPEEGILTIRTTVVNGKIQDSPKTEAGIRLVDLDPQLNDFLISHLETAPGLLFKSEKGGLVRTNTAYEHLEDAGIKEGFHSFRRFRITHLESVGVPPGLQRFWTGHAAEDVHQNYIKFGEKIEERKTWAVKAGLGFQLEAK
jgi:integrase